MYEVFVKDNFLNKNHLKVIQNYLLESDEFPWYYQDHKVYKKSFLPEYDNFVTSLYDYQLCHLFFNNCKILSDYYGLLNPFFQIIKPITILKIKANLTLAAPSVMQYDFHTDYPDTEIYHNAKTAIFYVNTNDGYTLFEGGSKISSIENRFVYFNSHITHAGTTTTDKRRVVINFNYF